VEGVKGVSGAVFDHFRNHFKSLVDFRPSVDDLAFKVISIEEGSSLTNLFSEEEVKCAIWDCDSFKISGPDGVNLGFFKDFWEVLKGDLMHFFHELCVHGKLTKEINSTFIVLIPKVDSPQCLADLRPISPENSIYKILSKVLANRMRQVVGSVISNAQSTFVKGRQILDRILTANELVDDARQLKKELVFLKWTSKRPMILWTGLI